MNKEYINNALLFAILMALIAIAIQQYMYRPVTQGDLIDIAKSGDQEKYQKWILRLPTVDVRQIQNTTDVDVTNSISVDH